MNCKFVILGLPWALKGCIFIICGGDNILLKFPLKIFRGNY